MLNRQNPAAKPTNVAKQEKLKGVLRDQCTNGYYHINGCKTWFVMPAVITWEASGKSQRKRSGTGASKRGRSPGKLTRDGRIRAAVC